MYFYLVYGCLPVSSTFSINFIKKYYHTNCVITINEKQFDLISKNHILNAEKIRNILQK